MFIYETRVIFNKPQTLDLNVMHYKKSTTKMVGRVVFAENQLRELMSSDRLYNCIAHHTVKVVPESKLKKEVYTCQKITPQEAKMNERLISLYERGVLDHLLAPESDEVNYRLTPAAVRAYKKRLLTIDLKYGHPKVEKKFIKDLMLLI